MFRATAAAPGLLHQRHLTFTGSRMVLEVCRLIFTAGATLLGGCSEGAPSAALELISTCSAVAAIVARTVHRITLWPNARINTPHHRLQGQLRHAMHQAASVTHAIRAAIAALNSECITL